MKNEANVIQIDDPVDDRLIEYRCLRKPARSGDGCAPDGVFIAEGESRPLVVIAFPIPGAFVAAFVESDGSRRGVRVAGGDGCRCMWPTGR